MTSTNLFRHFNRATLLGLVFLALSGCREKVTDDFPEFIPIPVVNSFLQADSMIRVHVSFSGKMDTVPLSGINNASVTLTMNDTLARTLDRVGDGLYGNDYRATAGNAYRFNVKIPGYSDITAIDTIPVPVMITAIEHINEGGIDQDGYKYPSVRMTIPVDPDKIQYFEVAITVNHFLDEWHRTNFKEFTDPLLLAEGLPIPVFSTERIEGNSCTIQIDYQSGTQKFNEPGTHSLMERYYPFFIELKSISKQYYQYLKQLHLYNTGRFPDFQFESYKAFPLFSNVTNGQGIVAGYSVYRSAVIYPKPWRP
jgi:hypothetical protein